MNLHWFRSDLRIHDNPALAAASAQSACVAVYCISEKQWEMHDVSPARRSLIVRQLRDVEEQLAKLNIPLVVLPTTSFTTLPKDLLRFCQDNNIQKLFFNREYEINEKLCARAVTTALDDAGIAVNEFEDQCVVPAGTVLNQQGEMFKIYTAFKRAYLQRLPHQRRHQAPAPRKQQAPTLQSNLKDLDQIKLDKRWQTLWPAGEAHAHSRLLNFVETHIENYARDRDFPAVDGTSTVSPYLAIGAITTTQCMDAVARNYEDALSFKAKSGAATWINEIIWREFYRHLLDAFPHLCKHKPFLPNTDHLEWKNDEKLFAAWCKGETGYPIVDAAMKQLNTWGWMHNRLRMVVAMFLTKHLFIDWRKGEKYFMQQLVDGDLASNNGGWQWSASTGVDAQPWFRIFNPTRQSERFDADGKFIRAYLPQLKNLDNKAIHQPSPMEAQMCGYPAPIVDHKIATDMTKARFKALL